MSDHPDHLKASDSLVAVDGFAPVPGYNVPPAATASAPPEPSPAPAPEPDDDDDLRARIATLEAAAAAPVAPAAPDLTAAGTPTAASGIPAAPRSNGSELTLARVSGLIASANRGEMTPNELTAALATSTTTDLAGIVPPAYVSELAGLINVGRPVVDAMRSRPLPPAGLVVTYPNYKTLPTVGTQATELTQVSSTKAEIELKTAPVVTTAGANEISIQSIDRGDPSGIEALLRALAEVYARKTDANLVAAIVAADSTTTPVGAPSDAVAMFGALAGALNPLGTPSGGLVLAVAWDIYVSKFATLRDSNKPAWWDGSVNVAAPQDSTGNLGGVSLVVDPNLAAGTVFLASRNAATFWENPGAPAQISTIQTSILGVDVGIYGYSAITVEAPGGIAVGNSAAAGPAMMLADGGGDAPAAKSTAKK